MVARGGWWGKGDKDCDQITFAKVKNEIRKMCGPSYICHKIVKLQIYCGLGSKKPENNFGGGGGGGGGGVFLSRLWGSLPKIYDSKARSQSGSGP